MAIGERCLLVHGHFYQPPRENPWTGHIEPQNSAIPWENWNRRIADECYIPMARSRLFNAAGEIVDLYNNYAHTSFNFGPTLLSWLDAAHPSFIAHLRDATRIDSTFPMAQVYSHAILPLADARDRHTQILWGVKEFQHRFGFCPEGMWLSECAIDPETLRALIDHRIRFVILSPHQASKVRPFGEMEWRDVSMGAIDTRRAYRVFEIDGGGRTHFDRHLDVIFYTPGLNLKVSFDHILNRPDDLAQELENCYRPDCPEAQLVSIVTDGEIYGHHEHGGEEALSRLFTEIAPAVGLRVVSAGEFVRDHPPVWEVKLWNGEDGRGSSWSCGHGVGRWHRDCGCHPPTPPGWNQQWRGPLRGAFDAIRDRVRETARRELGGMLWDVDDAWNDYVSIVLDPGCERRRQFVERHAREPLDRGGVERLWRVLEALHNTMLMYASCGWFFDELSGLEPVQNMRYALRAAELIQPYCQEENLPALLEHELAKALSNIPHFHDGRRIFQELVLPSRHSNRELAAALALCMAAGFPTDAISWKVADSVETVHYRDSAGDSLSWGSFVCHDERLDRFIKTSWAARIDDFETTGVVLHGYEEVQGEVGRAADSCPLAPDPDFSWVHRGAANCRGMKRQEQLRYLGDIIIPPQKLPESIRSMLYRQFSSESERLIMSESAILGAKAVPFLSRARRHGVQTQEAIAVIVAFAFEQEIAQNVYEAVAAMDFVDSAAAKQNQHRNAAHDLGIHPSPDLPHRALFTAGMEMFHWLSHLPRDGWFASLRPVKTNDGESWLAPRSSSAHTLTYWYASDLALALGKGLARLWERLCREADPAGAALRILPLPELLTYAGILGADLRDAKLLGIEFWDFLDRPLARLIQSDPTGLLAGEEGDRVRAMGRLLGFAEDAVEKRLLATLRAAL